MPEEKMRPPETLSDMVVVDMELTLSARLSLQEQH